MRTTIDPDGDGKGAITLTASRGTRIVFASGLGSRSQRYRVTGAGLNFEGPLPVCHTPRALAFTSKPLSEEVAITLRDESDGPEERFAIGLREPTF